MIFALLIIILSALLCAVLGANRRTARLGRLVAAVGVWLALAVSLMFEGLKGGLEPKLELLKGLVPSVFTSDALAAGLGTWSLLLGGLCLVRLFIVREDNNRLSLASLSVALVYALPHVIDLLVFAVAVFLLALFAWVFYLLSGEQDALTARSTFALGLGALVLLAAALFIGRTTGGSYSLTGVSLSALTVWPLVLVALFAVAWLGMAPLTGWSAHLPAGPYRTFILAVGLGVPVVSLILRLQELVTAEAVGGTVPDQWRGLMSGLVWAGCLTSLVGSAGTIAWAGRSRWPALQAAFWLGLVVWSLGLDTPPARLAAVLILLSYGAGRVVLEILPLGGVGALWVRVGRGVAHASLASMPLLPGFLGVWVLAVALSSAGRPSLVLLLVGSVILAACGTALDAASHSEPLTQDAPALRYLRWVGFAGVLLMASAGVLVPLWLPWLEEMSEVAGGVSGLALQWQGSSVGGSMLPLALLAAGALLFAALGRLILAMSRSGTGPVGALLPTAFDRLRSTGAGVQGEGAHVALDLLGDSPAPVWWLSMAWLDRGVWGFGALMGRLGSRFGGLLGRLEGRFYLPLAVILILTALLVVTR